MATLPTPEELVALFAQGTLAGEMARRFGLKDRTEINAIEARCAELHAEGGIDLMQLVETGALQALEGADFFMAVHFFCRILPELEVTPAKMMACVEALVARGGSDRAANQPNAALRDWCAKRPHLAREVIAAARDGDGLASRHLTFSLEAMSAIAEARQIALAHDDARRLSAVTALGRIKDDDPASRAKTLAAFASIMDAGADDTLRGNMLHATAAIQAQSRESPPLEVVALVQRLVEDAGEVTIHQCAHFLSAARQALQADIVACLLETLRRVNPANKGTIDALDFGLQSLLENGYDHAAIAYVTHLLSSEDGILRLEDLDSFTTTLLSGPPERLSRVVVQWLLLGAPRLCQGLADALRSHNANGPPLNIRADDLVIAPAAQVFVCRKAIGWFFFLPTTAASVLVSVLRVCDAETAQAVTNLLVERLLLNYAGVRDYLSGLAADDPAKCHVERALAENEAYLEALRAIPPIKEFEPSEHHRRIEQLRRLDQSREIQRQVQTKSVFLSLVKRSVLLYGNRSLTFVRDSNGGLRPVEMDLKPFGVSFEMPRLEKVDPVGLEYILRVFKTERMAS